MVDGGKADVGHFINGLQALHDHLTDAVSADLPLQSILDGLLDLGGDALQVSGVHLALVEGAVAFGGTLEDDLVHMPGLGYCKMVDLRKGRLSESERRALASKALHAITSYTPVGRTCVGNEERTLLEVTIYTGVTHQIRAQLALAGMHIVNDRLYGAFAVENMTGHCLHALAASFNHPISGELCEVRTALPEWWTE